MKSYKDISEKDLVEILGKFSPVYIVSTVPKDEKGYYLIPENSIFVDPYSNGIVISVYCRDVKAGREANKHLKSLGYYTSIIVTKRKSLTFLVACTPTETYKKYKAYL